MDWEKELDPDTGTYCLALVLSHSHTQTPNTLRLNQ